MKIHSYMDVNTTMNEEFIKLGALEEQLLQRVTEVDAPTDAPQDRAKSWNRAITRVAESLDVIYPQRIDSHLHREAFLKWADLRVQTGASKIRANVLLPPLQNEIPRSKSPMPEHRRLVDAISSSTSSEHLSPGLLPELDTDLRDVHPLIWHPDQQIKTLSLEISKVREALYSAPIPGQELGPMWPLNVSYLNFLDFQLVPSLVYKLQYPRLKEVRIWYVIERCVALFGTFLVLYVITVHWIIPATEDTSASLLSLSLSLMAPMISCYLLLFYLMFECVCQGFAEITRFADREFYRDWWNSTSMEEFSRNWNRPVHHFLLQHVYVSLIFRAGMSKSSASVFTFLLSSVFHEIVMIIVSGKIRGYLFAMQMSQIPLIIMARLEFIRSRPALANCLFWMGMVIGLPMLNILYLMF